MTTCIVFTLTSCTNCNHHMQCYDLKAAWCPVHFCINFCKVHTCTMDVFLDFYISSTGKTFSDWPLHECPVHLCINFCKVHACTMDCRFLFLDFHISWNVTFLLFAGHWYMNVTGWWVCISFQCCCCRFINVCCEWYWSWRHCFQDLVMQQNWMKHFST